MIQFVRFNIPCDNVSSKRREASKSVSSRGSCSERGAAETVIQFWRSNISYHSRRRCEESWIVAEIMKGVTKKVWLSTINFTCKTMLLLGDCVCNYTVSNPSSTLPHSTPLTCTHAWPGNTQARRLDRESERKEIKELDKTLHSSLVTNSFSPLQPVYSKLRLALLLSSNSVVDCVDDMPRLENTPLYY